jgi:hypothetical protein
MCAAIALLGACRGVPLFTRMAGELFGLLIAVLFMQQAVKVSEVTGVWGWGSLGGPRLSPGCCHSL